MSDADEIRTLHTLNDAQAAEIARLTAELEKCKEALRPFINATLTLDGKVIGLMREDFERASNAIDAARRSP